jgi:hypothetical protein
VLISGDMLLPKISTNVSVCRLSQSDPLARFRLARSFPAVAAGHAVLPLHWPAVQRDCDPDRAAAPTTPLACRAEAAADLR